MLQIRPLTPNQMAQMLPVLQQVDPAAEMPLMRRLLGSGGGAGVMAVADPNGLIRGGFAWEVERGADGAGVLFIHHVAIPQLGQTRVAELITTAMESLARTEGCGAVRLELPADSDWEADYFAARGHTVVRLSPAAH